MDSARIKVAIRGKPAEQKDGVVEMTSCIEYRSNNKSIIAGGEKEFHFDHVYNGLDTQETIYEGFVSPLVQQFVEGQTGTALAYGQTGSGKTHTMGLEDRTRVNCNTSDDYLGILPRLLKEIFEKKKTESDEINFKISFLEILNDLPVDLLSTERKNVLVRDTESKTVLRNLDEIPIDSLEEAFKWLYKGLKARTCGQTDQNQSSSRSHAMIIIYMKRITENRIIDSKIQLVDLAGSENSGNTQGIRFKEGVNINTSLHYLREMLNAISSGRDFINSRNCILTRILKDSLTSTRGYTRLIACISPNLDNLVQTLNTLDFAARARNIPCRHLIPPGKENFSFRRPGNIIPRTPSGKLNSTLPFASPATPRNPNRSQSTAQDLRTAPITSTGFRIPPRPDFSLRPEMTPCAKTRFQDIMSPLADKVFAKFQKPMAELLERTVQHELRTARFSSQQNNQVASSSGSASSVHDENVGQTLSSLPTGKDIDFDKYISPLARKLQAMVEETISKKLGFMDKMSNDLPKATKTLKASSTQVPVFKDLTNVTSPKQTLTKRYSVRLLQAPSTTNQKDIVSTNEATPPLRKRHSILSLSTPYNPNLPETRSVTKRRRTIMASLENDSAKEVLDMPKTRRISERRRTIVATSENKNSMGFLVTPLEVPKGASTQNNSMLAMPPPMTNVLPKATRSRRSILCTKAPIPPKRFAGGNSFSTPRNTGHAASQLENSTIQKTVVPGPGNSSAIEAFKQAHTAEMLRLLNQGTKQELQGLPTVGPKTADVIWVYRNMNGPFLSVQDILNVGLKKSFFKANCLQF